MEARSAQEDLPPRHAPSSADSHELLDLVLGDCPAVHLLCMQAQQRAASWLGRVKEQLERAVLGDITLEHPRDGWPSLRFPDVDPTTAFVFVAGGRRGVNDALDGPDSALYVGLVAQSTSGRWHGLAGVYVPLCVCKESKGWAAARRLLAGLEAVEVAQEELPAGLAPRAGWWDLRLIAAQRLNAEAVFWRREELTSVAKLGGPVLVSTGRSLTRESNLLLATSSEQLTAVTPHLPQLVSFRTGSELELKRLVGAQSIASDTKAVEFTLRSRRIPTGLCIVGIGGTPSTVTRDARGWLRASGANTGWAWPAPCVAPGGPIDLARLESLLAGARPAEPGTGERGYDPRFI